MDLNVIKARSKYYYSLSLLTESYLNAGSPCRHITKNRLKPECLTLFLGEHLKDEAKTQPRLLNRSGLL